MPYPDSLAVATEDARRLCQDGDLAGAHLVLRDALAGLPPQVRDPDVAVATRLFASVLAALGDPHTARSSAEVAYDTCLDVFGPTHAETLAAAATLASVLRTMGSHADAGELYEYLAETLSTVEGSRSRPALAAQADLATAWHAQGDCARARATLAAALAAHREAYGEGDPASIRMAARLGRMARDCGEFAVAQEYLDEARLACQYHLPADDPLTFAVVALQHAPPDPDHQCGHGRTQTVPVQRARVIEWPPDEAPEPVTAPPALVPAPVQIATVPAPARRPRHRAATTRIAVLLGLAAVLVAAGAGAVALARTRAPQSTDTAQTSATGSPTTAPAVAAEAPRDIRLVDHGTSVELTWILPAGAEGPLFVSGSSGNNPARPFQTLLPGSTTYTVFGLNPTLQYCFVLTLVYSTEVTAGSDPVCTRRGA
ncbi:MAG TPA: fibronectin type III domain-containing protein [Micromonosporaceae bacterium]|nr:fibronectin type III domain-containing protein [Micromonosporaceae bacterium]